MKRELSRTQVCLRIQDQLHTTATDQPDVKVDANDKADAAALCCNAVMCLALQQYHEAARLLREKGLKGGNRLRFVVEDGAGHHENAWRRRLAGALEFLGHGWYC